MAPLASLGKFALGLASFPGKLGYGFRTGLGSNATRNWAYKLGGKTMEGIVGLSKATAKPIGGMIKGARTIGSEAKAVGGKILEQTKSAPEAKGFLGSRFGKFITHPLTLNLGLPLAVSVATALPTINQTRTQAYANVAGYRQTYKKQLQGMQTYGPGYTTAAQKLSLDKAMQDQQATPMMDSMSGLPLDMYNLRHRGYL